eukprot:GHVP01058669.1.p1 GENE.GHVP01058669.1~~GHVP01058669.1.p1  ORF type:complete len:168 (-),score=29.01 GHVP01058669.1:162-665(-)
MLKDRGVQYTLVGHSERRQLFGETDDVVADKTAVCQKADLIAVVCIGELLEARKAGDTNNVLRRQLEAVIPKITNWEKIVIAYEPVWAIGTGVVATAEEVKDAHKVVRDIVSEKAGAEVAQKVRVIYGGSVSGKNCAELSGLDGVDGFLVGGASLKPEFVDIIKSKL